MTQDPETTLKQLTALLQEQLNQLAQNDLEGLLESVHRVDVLLAGLGVACLVARRRRA